MDLNRRKFLVSSAAGALAMQIASRDCATQIGQAGGTNSSGGQAQHTADVSAAFVPNRIAVSTYSFFNFADGSKLTIPECIETAARMGFDGVELL